MSRIKTMAAAAVIAVMSCLTVSAAQHDSVKVVNSTEWLTVTRDGSALVFSSLDWYRTVSVYGCDDGRLEHRISMRKESRKQVSQLLFMDLGMFSEGDYVIVIRNGARRAMFRMFVYEDVIVLYDMDLTA